MKKLIYLIAVVSSSLIFGQEAQNSSKNDKTQKELEETIGQIISNSFDDDFDEHKYNKKIKMRR